MDRIAIRRKLVRRLVRWYERNQRDLPWRRTGDPYPIWVSEVMLQQTRVAAVIPYYERFLARFPRLEDLARASEAEVLATWSGLGYYSRARNLQKAARQMVEAGGFPRDYASIRALAGVGDYTAAAVASIAFGLPHAAIDGNVRRVMMRLTGDSDADVGAIAAQLLDGRDPGRWNQALMELGATVCLPREPLCSACPWAAECEAKRLDLQRDLPPPKKRAAIVRKDLVLLVIRRKGRILLTPSPRVSGFWDLPELFSGVRLGSRLGVFHHAITNSQYYCEVREARIGVRPRECRWWDVGKLGEIPLSTAAKKALLCLEN
ncbi:MAG TPA: A/G-specific adenine glycosylase [Bryobacteraceae bacterium]|nr:A/G-specific adenine glycosylase [Bryobacteraceae bacterium]